MGIRVSGCASALCTAIAAKEPTAIPSVGGVCSAVERADEMVSGHLIRVAMQAFSASIRLVASAGAGVRRQTRAKVFMASLSLIRLQLGQIALTCI